MIQLATHTFATHTFATHIFAPHLPAAHLLERPYWKCKKITLRHLVRGLATDRSNHCAQ